LINIKGLVKALVVRVALIDVFQVPLTVEDDCVAGLGENFSDGNLLTAHPMHLEQHPNVVYAATDR
jgi:hypothetical protein